MQESVGEHWHYAGSVSVLVASADKANMSANCDSQPQSVSGLIDITEVSIQNGNLELGLAAGNQS